MVVWGELLHAEGAERLGCLYILVGYADYLAGPGAGDGVILVIGEVEGDGRHSLGVGGNSECAAGEGGHDVVVAVGILVLEVAEPCIDWLAAVVAAAFAT